MRNSTIAVRGLWLSFLLSLLALSGSTLEAQSSVAVWRRWETTLTTSRSYTSPYRDVDVAVTFTHTSSGKTFRSRAYWAGGNQFKVRAAFPKVGTWTWSSGCQNCRMDSDLHGLSGSVTVTASTGRQLPLFANGFPGLETSGHHLVYNNGLPFPWIGDTAWAAGMRATDAEWQSYLVDRVNKGFTVIQMAGAAPWMKNPLEDAEFNTPFRNGTTAEWNPDFWNNFADKVEAANNMGLVVLFAGLMEQSALYSEDDPERYPPLDDSKAFASNLVALLAGNAVIYSPGFDSDPRKPSGLDIPNTDDDSVKSLIKYMGNYVNTLPNQPMLTNHYATIPIANILEFQAEPWLDFQLFQSGAGWGNGDADAVLDRITERARSMASRLYEATPTKPAINGEAVYDGASEQPLDGVHSTRFRVRQTAYYSSFSGAFFYTYGAEGLWNWTSPGSIGRPSSSDMTHLRNLITNNDRWPHFKPRPELIREQSTLNHEMKVLITTEDDSDRTDDDLLAYLPYGGDIELDLHEYDFATMVMKWYDPTRGDDPTTTADDIGATAEELVPGSRYRFRAPVEANAGGEHDWVLWLTRSVAPMNLVASYVPSQGSAQRELISQSANPIPFFYHYDPDLGNFEEREVGACNHGLAENPTFLKVHYDGPTFTRCWFQLSTMASEQPCGTSFELDLRNGRDITIPTDDLIQSAVSCELVIPPVRHMRRNELHWLKIRFETAPDTFTTRALNFIKKHPSKNIQLRATFVPAAGGSRVTVDSDEGTPPAFSYLYDQNAGNYQQRPNGGACNFGLPENPTYLKVTAVGQAFTSCKYRYSTPGSTEADCPASVVSLWNQGLPVILPTDTVHFNPQGCLPFDPIQNWMANGTTYFFEVKFKFSDNTETLRRIYFRKP